MLQHGMSEHMLAELDPKQINGKGNHFMLFTITATTNTSSRFSLLSSLHDFYDSGKAIEKNKPVSK